jgi:N-acetylmuramoyl-L-alanine amidase
MRSRAILTLAFLLLALPATAVTVTTPQGRSEVFARGDLLDVVALLRLVGAEVQFAPAAGSYNAAAAGHEVQFTPGGSLAVVDGRLTPLPGPLRGVDGHVMGSLATAGALLGPFGWTVRGTAAALELVKVGGAEQVELSVVRAPSGTTLVLRGTSQRPRLVAMPGLVTLQFPAPVALARPVTPEAELLGGELHDDTLTLRLASGTEVASSYPLEDPPRFVLRLAKTEPVAPMAAPRTGSLVLLDPGHGGEDLGARGPAGETEKEITLAVARATAARLQTAGVTARLTREGDETLSLTDRTAVAREPAAGSGLPLGSRERLACARGARRGDLLHERGRQ